MRERSALPDLDVVTLSHPAGPPSSIRRSTRTTELYQVVVRRCRRRQSPVACSHRHRPLADHGPRTEEDTVLVSLPILVQCQWKHRHNMCEQGRKVMLEISAHVFFLEIAGAF